MNEEMKQQNLCKKCLLKDMPYDAYFKSLYDYIDSIDEDLKVDSETYEKRLQICKECDNLLKGMCRICGCFVELRACMKKNSCPNVDKRW